MIYTKHAEDRLRQRGITRSQIILTLQQPTSSSRLHDEPHKWVFRRYFGDKLLLVIAYRRGNNFKVKTAYYS
ncbi:MAG: DUF4258 domain-containing protein [Thaumarchaeota archaeon]|nr:DUF4258 domain-containing protein [Nitrososphaerota archaeon]